MAEKEEEMSSMEERKAEFQVIPQGRIQRKFPFSAEEGISLVWRMNGREREALSKAQWRCEKENGNRVAFISRFRGNTISGRVGKATIFREMS